MSFEQSILSINSVNEKVLSFSKGGIVRVCELLSSKYSYKALSIFVTSGGCAGINYNMSIVEDFCCVENFITHKIMIKQNGQLFKKFVFVKKNSLLFLSGMTIDYVEEETGGGFLFNNPNSKGACGCGKSFNV